MRPFKESGNAFIIIEQGIVFIFTVPGREYVSSLKTRAMSMSWMLRSFIIALNAVSFQTAAACHSVKPHSPPRKGDNPKRQVWPRKCYWPHFTARGQGTSWESDLLKVTQCCSRVRCQIHTSQCLHHKTVPAESAWNTLTWLQTHPSLVLLQESTMVHNISCLNVTYSCFTQEHGCCWGNIAPA